MVDKIRTAEPKKRRLNRGERRELAWFVTAGPALVSGLRSGGLEPRVDGGLRYDGPTDRELDACGVLAGCIRLRDRVLAEDAGETWWRALAAAYGPPDARDPHHAMVDATEDAAPESALASKLPTVGAFEVEYDPRPRLAAVAFLTPSARAAHARVAPAREREWRLETAWESGLQEDLAHRRRGGWGSATLPALRVLAVDAQLGAIPLEQCNYTVRNLLADVYRKKRNDALGDAIRREARALLVDAEDAWSRALAGERRAKKEAQAERARFLRSRSVDVLCAGAWS